MSTPRKPGSGGAREGAGRPAGNKKFVSVSVALTKGQRRKLLAAARRNGESVSSAVRRMFDESVLQQNLAVIEGAK